eukprot:scaffold26183_cov101-Isochrysis_galbana.AAC.1
MALNCGSKPEMTVRVAYDLNPSRTISMMCMAGRPGEPATGGAGGLFRTGRFDQRQFCCCHGGVYLAVFARPSNNKTSLRCVYIWTPWRWPAPPCRGGPRPICSSSAWSRCTAPTLAQIELRGRQPRRTQRTAPCAPASRRVALVMQREQTARCRIRRCWSCAAWPSPAAAEAGRMRMGSLRQWARRRPSRRRLPRGSGQAAAAGGAGA